MSTVIKRAWISLTLESGMNVTPLPAMKSYWEDEHQNILATPLSPLPSLISSCPKIKKRKMKLIKTQVFQD